MKLEEQPNNQEKISVQESQDGQAQKEKSPEEIKNAIAQKTEYANGVKASMSDTEKQLQEVRLSMGLPTDNMDKPHSVQSGQEIVTSVSGEVDDLVVSLGNGNEHGVNTAEAEKEPFEKKVLEYLKNNISEIVRPYQLLYQELSDRENNYPRKTPIVYADDIDLLRFAGTDLNNIAEQTYLKTEDLEYVFGRIADSFDRMLQMPSMDDIVDDVNSLDNVKYCLNNLIKKNEEIASELYYLDESNNREHGNAMRKIFDLNNDALQRKIGQVNQRLDNMGANY